MISFKGRITVQLLRLLYHYSSRKIDKYDEVYEDHHSFYIYEHLVFLKHRENVSCHVLNEKFYSLALPYYITSKKIAELSPSEI